MKFTKEDIEKIEKFISIKNRGYYADGGQVTEVYNRVLEKNVNVTNCGTCLRGRIQELENELKRFESLSERTKVEEVAPVKDEPKEEPVVAENEPEKKRVGRPKKS